MASYTANYRLHQWEPEDHFLRTDFNEDFAKLDAAIKGVSTAAAAQAAAVDARVQQLLGSLERTDYNLCNLLLQNYYDGKQTGHKKALVFDGFLDRSGIASLSSALVHSPVRHALYLSTTGQQTTDLNYGTQYRYQIGPSYTATGTFQPTGAGKITAIKLQISQSSENYTCFLSVEGPGGSKTVSGISTVTGERTVSISPAIPFLPGESYNLRVWGANGGTAYICSDTQGRAGFRMVCTPVQGSSGTLTGVSYTPGVSWTQAAAWVRHSGGTPAFSLGSSAMSRTGSRSTVNLEGEACVETQFRLVQAGSGAVVPKLTVSATQSVWIYDYGVMLM